MFQVIFAVLLASLCVDSLSLYGYKDVYIINAPEVEDVNFVEVDTQASQETSTIPPHTDPARMARYIVHNSDWTVLAYKSQHDKTDGFPMGTVISQSDGPVDNGTGVPYVYVSELEDVVQDTDKDPRCSFTLTLAQGDYCKDNNLDPQYPTCPQVTLAGKIERVKNGTDEEAFARDALFSRHPSMKTWPKDHHFFFMKLNIEQVIVLDYFGGPAYVSLDDYFNSKP